MYGLAVNLNSTQSGRLSNIDEISKVEIVNNTYEISSKSSAFLSIRLDIFKSCLLEV